MAAVCHVTNGTGMTRPTFSRSRPPTQDTKMCVYVLSQFDKTMKRESSVCSRVFALTHPASCEQDTDVIAGAAGAFVWGLTAAGMEFPSL